VEEKTLKNIIKYYNPHHGGEAL